MLLSAARLPARTGAAGNILRLRSQDRSRWDRGMIARGVFHLGRAATGDDLSEYHLQAGIAACHAAGPDDAATDWRVILRFYDQWVRISDSPIVALNRAVAVAHADGPDAGLAALTAIPNRPWLESYYLTHAVLGELESRRNQPAVAAAHFRRALALTELRSEREFLGERLRECEGG